MAKEKSGFPNVGIWAFTIGLVVAVILAFLYASAADKPGWTYLVLGILGLIVGLLNVTEKEVQSFLIAAVGFLLSVNSLQQVFTGLASYGAPIAAFFGFVSVFIAPAAAIVSIKALYALAKD